MNIQLLDFRFSAEQLQPIQSALARFTHWNEFKDRTVKTSPHRESDDIWVRWGRRDDNDCLANDKPFQFVTYYSGLHQLLGPLVAQLSTHVGGTSVGGILITRIPPNGQIYPHTDGGWHAKEYSKYCICIKADNNQSFNFEHEAIHTHDGDCFFFDNSNSHWVLNNSTRERISAIVCIKTKRGIHTP